MDKKPKKTEVILDDGDDFLKGLQTYGENDWEGIRDILILLFLIHGPTAQDINDNKSIYQQKVHF